MVGEQPCDGAWRQRRRCDGEASDVQSAGEPVTQPFGRATLRVAGFPRKRPAMTSAGQQAAYEDFHANRLASLPGVAMVTSYVTMKTLSPGIA
jgi:hypothetical protein